MKKLLLFCIVFLGTVMLLGAGTVHACEVYGYIYCDVNQDGQIDAGDKPAANVIVYVKEKGGAFTASTYTDQYGFYRIPLLAGGATYTITIGPDGLPPDATNIKALSIPYNVPESNGFEFSTETGSQTPGYNWLFDSATCREITTGACWMTAGGVKFDPLLMQYVAEKGPRYNFGGVTAPSCSLDPSDGGQWNFVDRALSIHFQGLSIDQVTCGNVEGIPPGSTSPKTPFNYIDFVGTGIFKYDVNTNGAGKKAAAAAATPPLPVYFFAHFEDRNEPGNENALLPDGGAKVDRLFVKVWTDENNPNGSIVYCIEMNNDCVNGKEPIPITGGNIQIHVSSCP